MKLITMFFFFFHLSLLTVKSVSNTHTKKQLQSRVQLITKYPATSITTAYGKRRIVMIKNIFLQDNL